MAFTEKSNWVVLVASILALVFYGAVIVPEALRTPVEKIDFAQPMICAIVAYIVFNVVGHIVAAASNPAEADKKDVRDAEIAHFGGRVEYGIGIAGACGGLFLAMARQDYFWIANSIFVMGLLGGLFGAITKLAAYHGPFQRW
jgi:hypothetical protein